MAIVFFAGCEDERTARVRARQAAREAAKVEAEAKAPASSADGVRASGSEGARASGSEGLRASSSDGVRGSGSEPLRTASAPATTVTSTAAIAAWNKLFPTLQADVLDAKGNVLAKSLPLRALLSPARQPSVFAFWATYCAPCIDEIPMFDALAADGHRIAGVSMDSANLAKLRSVLAEKKPRYPIGVLTPSSVKAAGLALDAGLPFTVVLDERGDVSALLSGATTPEMITAALARARDHR